MALTQASPKFWHPDPKLIDWLTNKVIPDGAKVLEIGPGTVPFGRANAYVDFVDIPGLENFHKIDPISEKLPFEDKSFDFVYSRHVLEDSWNPFALCEEMSRVGKSGYVETPSPIVELGRGVDGGSPPFRGYHHHRWIVWTANKELRFVSKYAFIEYCRFDEALIDELLKTQRYWNTHYLWTDHINYCHRQSPLDYNIPRDYAVMLADAMQASKAYTDDLYFPINGATS
jgi:Methyltransferase domain